VESLLQRSRYELKYLIDEPRVRDVRQFISHFLMPDPHAGRVAGQDYPSYLINSVYLDNPSMELFGATVRGHKNRFKLRARFYDERPTTPVYFEIKRRVNGTVLKERAKVRRPAAARLLTTGVWPDRGDLVDPTDATDWVSLRKFCELRDRLGAAGRCMVVYSREAWLTPHDNHLRVTFDRNVEGGPFDPRDPSMDMLPVRRTPQWVKPPVGGVVLELKFTDRFPNWMRDLVRIFDLQRCSMAKYIKCVHQMEPARREQSRRMAREQAERALLAGRGFVSFATGSKGAAQAAQTAPTAQPSAAALPQSEAPQAPTPLVAAVEPHLQLRLPTMEMMQLKQPAARAETKAAAAADLVLRPAGASSVAAAM
jgi:hypothetical protein